MTRDGGETWKERRKGVKRETGGARRLESAGVCRDENNGAHGRCMRARARSAESIVHRGGGDDKTKTEIVGPAPTTSPALKRHVQSATHLCIASRILPLILATTLCFSKNMPVTTTSRRQRRQPTEDIEDASLSQARADEVEDEDEDEAPPRRVRGAKREKMRLGPAEDADNLEVDDPLANFVDQPVDKQQATRISGLAQDWSQARKAYHQSSYALVRDIAASVAEFTDGEKGEKVRVLA